MIEEDRGLGAGLADKITPNSPLSGITQTEDLSHRFQDLDKIRSKIEFENISTDAAYPPNFCHPSDIANSQGLISTYSSHLETSKNGSSMALALDDFNSYNSQNQSLEVLDTEFERQNYEFIDAFPTEHCSRSSSKQTNAEKAETQQNKTLPGIILPPLLTQSQTTSEDLPNNENETFLQVTSDENLDSACSRSCEVFFIWLNCIESRFDRKLTISKCILLNF